MKLCFSRPMDQSTVFQHSLFPHIFINSKSSCFTQNPALSPRKTGNRPWKLTTCWAVGSSGSISDEDSFTKENLNGSLFDTLSDESSSPAPFGTLEAEITQETIDFFVSDAEGDPDCPSPGYSSVEQALTALRQGKFVIVVDDNETGNVEGNLVMAATHVSPEAIAFMVKHGSGIVSVGMKGEDLERLKLPLMSPDKEDDSSAPSFTITVDAKVGTSTGVSASDRAKTVLALSSPQSRPEDFIRPGHVFPLKYRNGGVLRRVGHTEASVDLVTLAGLRPVSVLSSVVDTDNVSLASLAELKKLASDHSIPVVLITDLIRVQFELIVEYHMGDIGNGQDVLVRVHSECLTGDIFGSRRCDCGNQLDLAMQLIEQAGRGVVVYLRGHEGRGIGLGHKLQAYNLQDEGHDTVEANLELGFAADAREYEIGAQILHDIGVHTMRLMTNNPAKFTGLKGYGLAVVGRVPVLTPITEDNKRYLETKRIKMGHVYGSDLQEQYIQLTKPSTDKQGSSEGKSTS
ncbi:UNVERIFIED_CONTAM: Monofunctional riboflavin biosynthesis protein RIBA 3, chloroplastic [Sesamum latifolium]|uniref:GTP cyclohydrolase II n=1 Tax=Sesamum latifolium TaxID=2727402 RepID=A0AAW2Y3I5_9LAMI